MNYIILAIPVFFLLIGIEVLVDKLRKTKHYRFNDAITNLSCGIGQQVTGVFLKTVVAIGYIWLYENYRLFDLPGIGSGSSTAAIVFVWIALFIGVDFFYYWFHRLAHEVSVLWGSHIVHHQSEEYNLTVALRQAWLQGAFSWVFYLPLAFVGFDPVMFITVNSFQTLYQFWIHTKAIDKMHPAFEYVFNTPSHHRVHHGVNPKYIDRNHGGTFIIFDRMFGTFQKEEEEVVYGITTQTKSFNPLWVNFQYWGELFADAWRAPGLKNKFLMLVNAPGWKPAEMGGVGPLKEVTPETFHKYDVEIPRSLNYYAFLQYLVILAGTTAFLFNIENLSFGIQAGVTGLIIISIVSLGGLFEKKKWAVYLEVLRILMIASALVTLWGNSSYLIPMVVISVLLVLISLPWLLKYRSFYLAASWPETVSEHV